MTFSGRYILNIIHFAARQGANMALLLGLTGYSEEELNEESTRLSSEIYNQVVEKALELTGDKNLGLHIGESMSLSAAGLITQIVQTSRTVKEALEHCCEFAALGCRALPMDLVEEKEFYKLRLLPDAFWLQQSAESVKHTANAVAAFIVREFQALSRNAHNPVAFHTSFQDDINPTEYERVLHCPVRFNKEEITLFLKKEHVDEPVITSNYSLLNVLVAHAHEKLAAIQHEEVFSSMVKQTVINLMQFELPTIEQVAAQLNMSVRTLQRKLATENANYKDLLEDLRRQSSISYLKNPDLAVKEIAYLLNYSDSASFIRSFKRWMGKTPGEYREHNYKI